MSTPCSRPLRPTAAALGGELLTVRLRWKRPTGSRSDLITTPVLDRGKPLRRTSDDFRWSAAVAAWGMRLQGSRQTDDFDYDEVLELARGAMGDDVGGYRAESWTWCGGRKT
jgi:Ca-activated chloride channel family protein